jgi:hypothetical protein
MRKLFASLLAVCVLNFASGISSASIVTYDMFINGSNEPVQVLLPGTHTIEVRAQVTDNDLAPSTPGGILQSAFDLDDTSDLIRWTDVTGGFLGGPNGLWDSDAADAFDSHFQGTLTEGGTKVVAETGAVAPGNFTAKFASLGANVWSTVASGSFELASGQTTLNLIVPNALNGDILVAGLAGSSVAGRFPTEVILDSITIGIPEPSSLVLLGSCVAGLIMRRRSA